MKTTTLSTIYLDNKPVGLMGDPFPPVAKVLAAGGRAPDGVRVERSLSAVASRGIPVRLDDILDRTADPTKAIYLTCRPAGAEAAPVPRHHVAWPMPPAEPAQPRGPLPPQPDPVRPPAGPDPEGPGPAAPRQA